MYYLLPGEGSRGQARRLARTRGPWASHCCRRYSLGRMYCTLPRWSSPCPAVCPPSAPSYWVFPRPLWRTNHRSSPRASFVLSMGECGHCVGCIYVKSTAMHVRSNVDAPFFCGIERCGPPSASRTWQPTNQVRCGHPSTTEKGIHMYERHNSRT